MSEENKEGHLCVLCNNRLESKEALREHFRKHANKEIDGKGRPVDRNGDAEFDVVRAKARGYEKGTASKYVDGVIVCDVCGEKFKCNTTAIQHKFRKHPFSNSKFYCPQCGMQFPLKIHRDKHLLNHSPPIVVRDVRCHGCGESFYNKKALDYHYSSMHQRLITLFQPVMTPPPSKKIKVNNAGETQSVYYCHLCGFEYIVKFNLQKHLERQHSQVERDNAPMDMIKCTTCEALFYNQRAYQNHNLYHRPDDLYVLTEEQRLATVTRVDQDFDIRRCVFGPEKYLPTYQRRRRTTTAVPKPVKKQKDESSDEMSPPSSMDTSSESESDIPLNKLLEKHQAKKLHHKKSTEKSKSKVESRVKVQEINKSKGVEGPSNSLEENQRKFVAKSSTEKLPKTDPSKETPLVCRKSPNKKAGDNLKETNECEQNKISNNVKAMEVEADKKLVFKNKDMLGSRSNLEPVVVIEKYKSGIVTEIIISDDDSDCEVLSKRFSIIASSSSKDGKLTKHVSDPNEAPTQEDIKESATSNQTNNKQMGQSKKRKNFKGKKQVKTKRMIKSKPKSETLIHDVIEIEDSS